MRGFIHLLWECLHLKQAPEAEWWLDTFVTTARQLEGNTTYTSRNPKLPFEGPLWQFVEREVRRALREDWTTQEACERWYSGAYLLETMPCVLYILARHGDKLEEAIVRAVNDTKDNDTIAAIVGAAVGAVHGREGIPEGNFSFSDYTQEVLDFTRALNEYGFIQPFRWVDWVEGKQLVERSDLLKRASVQTLRKLLTAHVRADRYNEGHLAAKFESGHIAMILKRIEEIYNSGLM